MSLTGLPRRPRGRLTGAAADFYDQELFRFCQDFKEIAASLDFRPGTRGWCYLLEAFGVISKGDFDKAARLLTDLRKTGLLPLDICAEDGSREWLFDEQIDGAEDDHASRLWDSLDQAIDEYSPVSFWEDQEVYLQMLVEKIDLRELFAPVCRRWRVPLCNAKGWSDLHSRAAMMFRFAEHEAQGRQGVLLYCGDFDPVGLAISDALRSNMHELARAVGWGPDRLVIERFGLHAEFIEQHGLSWIDGLETGSGRDLADPRHPDHGKEYVQDYLRRWGARKCEANALVVKPKAARKLCGDAICRYLPDPGLPEDYEEQLRPRRDALRLTLAANRPDYLLGN